MEVLVNKEYCIGCNLCPRLCKEVFRMTEQRVAECIVNTVPTEHETSVKNIAFQCPGGAIKINK